MKPKDYYYVEARLCNPCEYVAEAYLRLLDIGLVDEANALMAAMQDFTDKCREIQYAVRDKYQKSDQV